MVGVYVTTCMSKLKKHESQTAEGTLYKPTESIAIVPKDGDGLSRAAKLIFNVLCKQVQEIGDPNNHNEYKISLAQVLHSITGQSRNYEWLKEALRELVSTRVEWNYHSGKGEEVWGITPMLSAAEIKSSRSGDSHLVFEFSNKIRERIVKAQMYARINLEEQKLLRSNAAVSLYEIVCRYHTSPSGLTMQIPPIRCYAMLSGTPIDKIDAAEFQYKYFKRDILDKAIAEIHAETNFTVELIEHKSGRKVIAIQFKVGLRAQQLLSLNPTGNLDLQIQQLLTRCGISLAQCEELVLNYSTEQIGIAASYLEARLAAIHLPKIAHPYAYLKRILQDIKPPVAAPASNEVELDSVLATENLKIKFLAQLARDAETYYAELDQSVQLEQVALFERWVADTKNPTLQTRMKKQGLKSKSVHSAFFQWLARETWGDPTENELLSFAATQMARRH